MTALGLLPEKRQLRLAIWRYSYVYVGVVLQDREYEVEVPLKDVGCIPLIALQKYMLPDCVVSSLRKLSVVADQHSPLIVRVDRQLVVTDPAQSCIGRSPGVVAKFAKPCSHSCIDVMVTHESQRQATVSRRTASTSLTVSMGNASSTSSVERPAARYRWIVSTGTRVPASSGLLPSAPRRRSTFPTRA